MRYDDETQQKILAEIYAACEGAGEILPILPNFDHHLKKSMPWSHMYEARDIVKLRVMATDAYPDIAPTHASIGVYFQTHHMPAAFVPLEDGKVMLVMQRFSEPHTYVNCTLPAEELRQAVESQLWQFSHMIRDETLLDNARAQGVPLRLALTAFNKMEQAAERIEKSLGLHCKHPIADLVQRAQSVFNAAFNKAGIDKDTFDAMTHAIARKGQKDANKDNRPLPDSAVILEKNAAQTLVQKLKLKPESMN